MSYSPASPHEHAPSVWTSCRCCAMLQLLPAARRGHRRVCPRCNTSFGSGIADPEAGLAVAAAVLMLFAIAQYFPLMRMELEGISHSVRIGSGVTGFMDHHFTTLAVLMLGMAIAAPLWRIVAMLYVMAALHTRERPADLIPIFKLSEQLRAWAMLDVFLLGALVALSKLRALADITIGIGFWALGAVVLALAVLEATFDRRAVWDALYPPPRLPAPPDGQYWVSCHTCELLQQPEETKTARKSACVRCGSVLHRRKPDSMNRTLALVIAGIILYIPANLYPVITVISFGRGAPSTIMGGVRDLLTGNDWPLALIVFTASIIFPLLKLLTLILLMLSVRMRSGGFLKGQTRLYRIIEFVGRWSNIDVFVSALLTALVTLGNIATVDPGPGVFAFGAVVVLTMLATESFDPRLIWDAAEARHGE